MDISKLELTWVRSDLGPKIQAKFRLSKPKILFSKVLFAKFSVSVLSLEIFSLWVFKLEVYFLVCLLS